MATLPRSQARLAGVLYLVTHVTSVLAVFAYGDATNHLWVRLGVLLEFVLALGCLGTGVLLCWLLHGLGPVRALTFALLRTLEAAVIVAGTLPMLAIVWAGAPSRLLIDLHAASFLLGQGLVIGVNTLVLASLLLTSRFVVRPLAVLGLAGGALVLASDVAQLLGLVPLNGALAGALAVPIFAFEIWLAVTLLIARRPGTTPAPGASPSSRTCSPPTPTTRSSRRRTASSSSTSGPRPMPGRERGMPVTGTHHDGDRS